MVKIPITRYGGHAYELGERDDTPEELKVRTLMPVPSIQRVIPRVCATCYNGRIINGTFECLRPNGYQCDAGDGNQWFHVCKFYKREV